MATWRGTVVAFNGTTWLASVRLDGSAAQTLDDVRVNRGLDAAEVTAGRRCLVEPGEGHDPNDAVLIAVYA
jgi:hypothetical protein